jgi:hypothetical protein
MIVQFVELPYFIDHIEFIFNGVIYYIFQSKKEISPVESNLSQNKENVRY